MRNSNKPETTDLEECKRRIFCILREFNCSIEASDDYCWALLRDNDTDETVSAEKE